MSASTMSRLCRRLLLPAALLLGVGQVHAGLIAHYKFDETSGTTAADSSGNGNTGTLTNMAGTEWTAGKVGGALNFDGLVRWEGPLGEKKYAYVYLPQILDIGSGGWWEDTSYTISMWVKIPVVGQGNLDPGEAVGKILSNYVGTPTLTVGVHSDGKIRLTSSSSNSDGSSDLRDNQWHHLAFVRGSSSQYFPTDSFFYGYVDGVIELSTGRGLHNITLDRRHRIGMDYIEWPATQQKPFHGSLDDFRIYNHALSAGEVSALAGGGGGGGGAPAGGSAPEPASVFASLGLLTAAGCGLREWRRRKKKA